MPNCRHGVLYQSDGARSGCTSHKQKTKPYETKDKVKCVKCSGPWSDDAKAKKECPFHEAYKD